MAYSCCNVGIILRQPKFKKSHNECIFRDVCSRKQTERKNQIMKLYASGNVHFVYVTSLLFDVIANLYPKDHE